MTRALWIAIALIFPPASGDAAAQTATPATPDSVSAAWMQTILDSWEGVAVRHLGVSPAPLPWTMFYDARGAWHLAPDLAQLPEHTAASTALRFAGTPQPVYFVPHAEARLWVPGRDRIPVSEREMPFAAMVYGAPPKPFSIIALPALFRGLAPPEQAPHLDELFLGSAAHELTHTLHLPPLIATIEDLRARFAFPESFDDNLVQQQFAGRADYEARFNRERELTSAAILEPDDSAAMERVREMLAIAAERRERFFVGEQAGYTAMEDLFAILEGVAMWAQFQSVRDRAPPDEEWLQTLIRLSERTDSWSQLQGLGLYLLIDRFVPGWQRHYLDAPFPSPFDLLQAATTGR